MTDVDENPVVLRLNDEIVITDQAGEVHRLRTKLSNAYGPAGGRGKVKMVFKEISEGGAPAHEWTPELRHVYFVPREHILGRPVLGFWPIWPFGPHRFGFIR